VRANWLIPTGFMCLMIAAVSFAEASGAPVVGFAALTAAIGHSWRRSSATDAVRPDLARSARDRRRIDWCR
jgi:hypothetical protein